MRQLHLTDHTQHLQNKNKTPVASCIEIYTALNEINSWCTGRRFTQPHYKTKQNCIFLCWTSSKPENLEHTVGCFSDMSHVSISISFSIAQSLSTILGSEQQVTGSGQYCTVEKTFSVLGERQFSPVWATNMNIRRSGEIRCDNVVGDPWWME